MKELNDDSQRLITACHQGNIELARQAIASGADTQVDNNRPLQLAAMKGYKEIVELLLSKGANIHVLSDCPLQMAAMKGHTHIVTMLAKDASVKALNDSLILAAEGGYPATVSSLLDLGANVNTDDGKPLRSAARMAFLELVNKNLDTIFGRESTRAESNYEQAVSLLLDRGANINAGGQNSALCNAAQTGNRRIANLLLDRGADVNVADAYPLRLAAFAGDRDMALLLAERGADTSVRRSPSGFAPPKEYDKMLALLDDLAATQAGKLIGADRNPEEASRKTNLQERIAETKNKASEGDGNRDRETSTRIR